MHEMMKLEDIDAVSVLTESGNHARNTIDLAQYGVDILVEKPMALKLEDADKMIRECNLNGSKLFVIKQNRFNVPVIKLREALEAERFGKLIMGTVRLDGVDHKVIMIKIHGEEPGQWMGRFNKSS